MWNFLKTLFSSSSDTATRASADSENFSYRSTAIDIPPINPATGLPMISGYGGLDVGGSPYGVNLHDDHHSRTSIDSSSDWSHTNSSFASDDSWKQHSTEWSNSSTCFDHHNSIDTLSPLNSDFTATSNDSWSSSSSDWSNSSNDSWSSSSSTDWSSSSTDFGNSSNSWD